MWHKPPIVTISHFHASSHSFITKNCGKLPSGLVLKSKPRRNSNFVTKLLYPLNPESRISKIFIWSKFVSNYYNHSGIKTSDWNFKTANHVNVQPKRRLRRKLREDDPRHWLSAILTSLKRTQLIKKISKVRAIRLATYQFRRSKMK